MASEIILSGVTFTNSIAKALPIIPNLQVLGFFGSGFDNINTNRVPGGNVLNFPGPASILSPAAMTLGLNGITPIITPITAGGALTGINITNPGSNLTSPPLIVVGSGAGTTGQAVGIISGGLLIGATVTLPATGLTNASVVSVTGGNYSYINPGLPRSNASLLAGWTWAAVVRVNSLTGTYSLIFTDDAGTSNGVTYQLYMRNADGANGGLPTLGLQESAIAKQFLTLPSNTASYRFVALTYSGGLTGGVFNLYNLTDGITATPYAAPTLGVGGNESLMIGPRGSIIGAAVPTGFNNPFDLAFAMVTASPLSLVNLQAIYASVKSSLARRSIII
jgi:hypothetical protein